MNCINQIMTLLMSFHHHLSNYIYMITKLKNNSTLRIFKILFKVMITFYQQPNSRLPSQ